tara:strand:- start:199 stop:393 length:195 start_codon:yes stop_codon:yes gene_type:complete
MPKIKTTNVCIVIGTGQKGTCIFEDNVNKIHPNAHNKTDFKKYCDLDVVGKKVLTRIELFFIYI